jgi:hypothetical protein
VKQKRQMQNTAATRCPFCARFISPRADGFYARSVRGDNNAPVAAFCSEAHADRFHGIGAPKPADPVLVKLRSDYERQKNRTLLYLESLS